MQTRQIVLDTETTGLDPGQGHRIIEIGCIELLNRRLTGSRFHCYLQPDREIDPEALKVHGLTREFLADKPRFADIAEDLLGFIRGAELIIHNAPFDVGFLDHELRRWQRKSAALGHICHIMDTLELARQRHPGQKNTLDALCKRYDIDNTQRTLHGALLDAEILADVYLAMTREQVTLTLAESTPFQIQATEPGLGLQRGGQRAPLTVIRASAEESTAHEHYLEMLDNSSGGHCLWKRLETSQ